MSEIDKIALKDVPRPMAIEIDASCHAVYIRFTKMKVRRTVSDTKSDSLIAIDLDAKGKVIGIELVGVAAFSVKAIRGHLPEQFRKIDLDQAEFVATPSRQGEPVAA